MPKKIGGKPVNEHKWKKAKQVAAEQGRAEDYAYIMGIYKKMTKSIGGGTMLSIIRKVKELSKSKKYPAGTIRDWKGKKFQKQANGEWHEVKHPRKAGSGGGDDGGEGGDKGSKKQPKYVEIGDGLYINKVGRDSNGNSSIWVSQGSNPSKKIQINGILTHKSSVMIEGLKFFQGKDDAVAQTIKQVKSYWNRFLAGDKKKKEYNPAEEGIKAAKEDAAKQKKEDKSNPAEEGIKAARADTYFKNSIMDFIKKHGESEYKPTFQVQGGGSHTNHIDISIDQLKKLANHESGSLLTGKDDWYVKDHINAIIKKMEGSEYKPTIKFYGVNDAHTNNMDVSIDVLKNAIGEYGKKESKKQKGVDDKIFDQKQFGVSDNNEDLGADGHELMLFLQNDGDLYRQQYTPILKNIARKLYNGTYEHAKAARLWEYIVESAAKKYAKENGITTWHDTFPKKTRVKMSQALADEEFEKFKNKEYDIERLRKLNKSEAESDIEQLIKSWELDMEDTSLILTQEFLKSIQREEKVLILNKGRGLAVGTIRDWKGKKFKKEGDGKWKEVKHPRKAGSGGGDDGGEGGDKEEKQINYFVNKYNQKMYGSTEQTAAGWVDGIHELSKETRAKILARIKQDKKAVIPNSAGMLKTPPPAGGKEKSGESHGLNNVKFHDPKHGGYKANIVQADLPGGGHMTYYHDPETGQTGHEYYTGPNYDVNAPKGSKSHSRNWQEDQVPAKYKDIATKLKKIHEEKYGKVKKSLTMPDTLMKSIVREEEFLRLNRNQTLAIGTIKDDGNTFWEKTGVSHWSPIEKAQIEYDEIEPLNKALGDAAPVLAVFDNQGDDNYNRFTVVLNGKVYSTDGQTSSDGRIAPTLRLRGKLVKVTEDGLLIYSNEQHMYPIGVRIEEIPAAVIAAVQAFVSGNVSVSSPAIAKDAR